ncbi:MAG TPA: hypothetical protein VME46_20765, partial [Acidimicrobiales bacterium]|nr:hypothetical protein [Acidimicrobiales bacterium]
PSPLDSYSGCEEHSLIIRRSGRGVDVDITGLSLLEASNVMVWLNYWLHRDQPKVRVISAGAVVGTYRKRTKR